VTQNIAQGLLSRQFIVIINNYEQMIGISCLIKVRLIKMNFQIQEFSNLFEISRGDLKSHVGSFHSTFLIYLMINESFSPFYLHQDS